MIVARNGQVLNADYVQTGGTTRVNGSLATAGVNSGYRLQGGRLDGSGSIDFGGSGVHVLLNSAGIVGPGNSPGILTVNNGDYVQGAAGTFEYELFGAVAGTGHDLLVISNGDADLGGELSVLADLAFALSLNLGDQFEVVRLGGGAFLGGDLADQLFDTVSVNLAGLAFEQLLIGDSLFIEVTQNDVVAGVPVPGPLGLLVPVLLAWQMRSWVTFRGR